MEGWEEWVFEEKSINETKNEKVEGRRFVANRTTLFLFVQLSTRCVEKGLDGWMDGGRRDGVRESIEDSKRGEVATKEVPLKG